MQDGTPIAAEDATFYVALFADAACTQRESAVQALSFSNSSVATVEFTELDMSKTYYVGETDAAGNVISQGTLESGEIYVADFSNGNQVVTEEDGVTTVTFDNQFYTLPRNYYKEGQLTITKKLLAADGTAKSGNETFYAGIFADEAYTTLSDQVSVNIVELSLNGAAEASATVSVSFPDGGSTTLYVTEVDASGNPVAGSASFQYEMTVDQSNVTISEDNLEATVTIINKEQEEPGTEATEESSAKTSTQETQTEQQAQGVKTGDDTPIALYLTLFLAAALVLLEGERRRRRTR
jgi:hypothetical protein